MHNWLSKLGFTFDFNPYMGYQYGVQDSLRQLFQAEYILGELNRRAHANPQIAYSKRFEYMTNKIRIDTLLLAKKIGNEDILPTFFNWINDHSAEGFTNNILEGDSIDEDGNVKVNQAFSYNIFDDFLSAAARSNSYFLDEFIESGYDEDEPRRELSPQEKYDIFHEMASDYGDFQEIQKWLKQCGIDVQSILSQIIMGVVYPNWLDYWGGQIEDAYERVSQANDYLIRAFQTDNLGEILAAINIALNTQHTTGLMIDEMGISKDFLNELSNLNTANLDAYVDRIIGDVQIAAHSNLNWLQKIASPVLLDDEGNPRTFYHGTDQRFDQFERRPGKRYVLFSEFPVNSPGHFFTEDRDVAQEYGRNVLERNLNIDNLLLDPNKYPHMNVDGLPPELEEQLRYILEPMIDKDKGTIDVGVGAYPVRDDGLWIYNVVGTSGLHWDALDNEEVVNRMKELGYDGTYVDEGGDTTGRSIFVVDNKQILPVRK